MPGLTDAYPEDISHVVLNVKRLKGRLEMD